MAKSGPAVVADKATGIALTPGLEQLSREEISARFMGLPAGKAETKQKADDSQSGTGDDNGGQDDQSGDQGDSQGSGDDGAGGDDNGEGDGAGEDGAGDGSGNDDGGDDDGKGSDLEKGLDKALKDHPGLRKRFNQLLRENPKLKRELAEAQKAAAAKPRVLAAPTTQDPLASVTDEASLAKAEDAATWWLDWCDAHPQGGVINEGTADEQTLTADQVVQTKQQARKIQRAVPGRRDWLKTYTQTSQEVGAEVEAILAEGSQLPEAKVLATVPELMRHAEYPRILADLKAGRELREKKAQGITFVEVDPKKKGAAKPGSGGGKAPGSDKTPPSQTGTRPAPKSKDAPENALATVPLADLRARAAKGDGAAQAEITRRFVG